MPGHRREFGFSSYFASDLSAPGRLHRTPTSLGGSEISGDLQQVPNWCEIAMTGDCFVEGSSSARPGIVIATGESILVCAQGHDVALLESLEVGWEYRLYGRTVETLAEGNGARISNRFHLLPAVLKTTPTRDNCERRLLKRK